MCFRGGVSRVSVDVATMSQCWMDNVLLEVAVVTPSCVGKMLLDVAVMSVSVGGEQTAHRVVASWC